MLKEAINQMKTALILLILLSILTGFIYPLTVTGLAQIFFPWKANGSLIKQNNQFVGSKLIGQPFSDARYFWGRPSATAPYAYNGAASSGSNLSSSNPNFLSIVKERMMHLKQVDPQNEQAVPIDLVTASGSGLDPEISPYAANYQVPRIAKIRKLPEADVYQLVEQYSKLRTWRILGEPRVNVLELNIALDNLRSSNAPKSP
ncbi:potassium-transporting ATPase subunit KdpC [Legionella saoudiensis]|uniref:potassium-transporting ATPase subunit KdpC n=1 Tax=Legionella saoudiensis TaxID=1750561 RepID=UPI00072FCD94|nr:potassium-transporting ATPase subunit KdpC [Legionella saoudiensis]